MQHVSGKPFLRSAISRLSTTPAAAPVVAVDRWISTYTRVSSSAWSASRAAASRRCCSPSPNCSAHRPPITGGSVSSRARTWSR